MTRTEPSRWSLPPVRRMALVAAGLASLPASATELVTALPHEFVVGPARGFAIANDVDTSGSRHVLALPSVDAARVAWQRHVPGGIGANLLVDAESRIFAVGTGRVTQLRADGGLEYSQAGEFSNAVAAALLTDGTRAVLTREGRVIGWSPGGSVVFDVALEAPSPQSSSSLLPLPDGGALASVGEWLLEIDATRVVRSYASLPAPIQHAFLIGARALVVDEQGRVFEWNRRELPRRIGAFSAPLTAALVDSGSLLGLTAARGVERMDCSDGGLRELIRVDPPGAAPVLASIEPGRWVIMKPDGSWFSLRADAAANAGGGRSRSDAPTHMGLLADSLGTVAWWASDVPLHLETGSGVGRQFVEVRCAAPTGLVPAGPSRIVAACSSGAIWLIGPVALPER
jgi:hypothetical protein